MAISEAKEMHMLKICAGRIKLNPDDEESLVQLSVSPHGETDFRQNPSIDDIKTAFSTLMSETFSCIPATHQSIDSFR